MQSSALTQSLSFGLDINKGRLSDLQDGSLESRRIRNEVNRLDKQGWDWSDIETTVENNADHVQNTTQLIVKKSLEELETYHKHKDDDWGRPYPYIDSEYPVVMNHEEGYRLFRDDDDTIRFRITATKGTHVKGELQGSKDQFERLQTALQDDKWRVGTAELVHKHDTWNLHVTVTHKTHEVATKNDAETVIGVDINEDCIALVAMDLNGQIQDSVIVDYPSVKEKRHEFFNQRKRMQEAGQTAFESVVQTEEKDYVHDRLHKVSREAVEWVSQYDTPLIVFEDLKDMRDNIEYGTRMNRRLHSLPFAKLREMVTYKAAWNGIPADDVDPEYTSQRCPETDCQYTARANRKKKRFKCRACGFQDHADRKAAVCVLQNWFDDQYGNVPSLARLPRVKKLRRTASGSGGGTDSHGTHRVSGVYHDLAQDFVRVREELNSVASSSDG